MHHSALLVALCIPFNLLFAEEQIKGTITEIIDSNNKKAVLIDIDNSVFRNRMASALATNADVLCYSQKDNSGDSDGPLLVHKRSGGMMQHDNLGRDLGIGAALCAAGCLFVLVAGEATPETRPNGFYATVGDKTTTGAPACIAGILGTAGLVFMLKGFIEIFIPPVSPEYGHKKDLNHDKMKESLAIRNALQNGNMSISGIITGNRSTKEILTTGNYKVVNKLEKTVSEDDYTTLENWIKRYCISL